MIILMFSTIPYGLIASGGGVLSTSGPRYAACLYMSICKRDAEGELGIDKMVGFPGNNRIHPQYQAVIFGAACHAQNILKQASHLSATTASPQT
jgi:hypothetical protein